jgi:DNA recombination protein RmuC
MPSELSPETFAVASVVLLLSTLVAILALWFEKNKTSAFRTQLQEALLENGVLSGKLHQLGESLASSESAKERLSAELKAEQGKSSDAEKQLLVIEERLKEREASFKQQIAQFDEQKSALAKEFEVLANRIIEEKGKQFTQASQNSIDQVLKPFRTQLDGFNQRINQVHTESVKGNSKLEEQIKHVLEVGLKMSDEASGLASALKGDKKAQGCWSEVQAELLLEMSGLKEGREYEREASFKTDEGKDQRPDFIINLPNDKHIIIDSKISLNAYVSSMSAETEEERSILMRAHVDAIRKHVKDLSDKNYPKLKGVNSPEYVFMFIGNEPAYLAAFDHEPNLFQEAYRKGIAIVTPNTLLSSLRIVSHLWSIDKQNANTRELAEQASKVYDKLRVFCGKMEKLGSQITTVSKTYDESWSTLSSGRGSLSKQVDKFVEMGVSVKEKLPKSVAGDELDALDS